MAETFANYERYILQPKKTEALKVVTSSRKEIVEEEFKIKLSLKEIMKLKNVGDLLNLINLKANTRFNQKIFNSF